MFKVDEAIRRDAVRACARAVELDPDNLEGWNQRGYLLLRTGRLNEAQNAFGKSKAIAESKNDRQGLASVYGNHGTLYAIRGDMAQAETRHKKALEIDQVMGNKEGIVSGYANLGTVYG